MRALILAVGLALVVAGCDSGSPSTPDAAELVPPDALAFVSVDESDREGWRTVRELTGRSTVGMGEAHYALLDLGTGEPTVVTLARSDDDQPARLGRPRRRIRIEKIGDWLVAAQPAAFALLRAAESGRSLADVPEFKRAMGEVEGDALATAYANGSKLAELPGELGALARVVGSPEWVGAKLVAGENAAQFDVRTATTASVYRPRLLREVPSGALLAVSFKNSAEVLRRLAAELDEYRTLFADLIPAVRGEGIIYVTQGALLPTIVLMVESPNPVAAAGALRRLGQELAEEANGFVSFEVTRRGNRVTLTNAAVPPAIPTRRLVDDQAFKDVLGAADAPDEVSWLAYADVERLAPTVEALSQLLGMRLNEQQRRTLARLGTVAAFGARGRLVLRVSGR
jgi:hypothetical protein